ncbi:MAG: ABC transporter permease subunit [Kurthia gibsonii]
MLLGAIKNELEKLYWKKRIYVLIGVIVFFTVMMMAISYFDKEDITKVDWKKEYEQQIIQIDRQMELVKPQSSEYQQLKEQHDKMQYQLKHDINPEPKGAASLATSSISGMFIKIILPILIVIIAADMITGESSNGTMKSMLVSPAGRTIILSSKILAALIISISVMILSDLLTYLSAIPFYGLGSWHDMVVIGIEGFRAIPMWEYMMYGLILNILTIATLVSVFILISVLLESISNSIILSISLIVIGGLLANLQGKVDALKYFFILNLDSAAHLTNEFTLKNTSFSISITVMIVTMIIALSIAFTVFNKKDMLV